MRISFDPAADAAYVYLVDHIGEGEAVTQVVVEDDRLRYDVVLDLDSDGRLVGVEVLGARDGLPPEILERAEKIV